MKFKAYSKLDNIFVGIISGLILAFIVSAVIINANSDGISVWHYYKNFFNSDNVGVIIRPAVLTSLKGGAIANLALFYLFLNKKMMKSVKGLIAVVASIGILVVWGILS